MVHWVESTVFPQFPLLAHTDTFSLCLFLKKYKSPLFLYIIITTYLVKLAISEDT